MSNNNHDVYEQRNQKWREASVKSIDLRYSLEDVLASFSEEEKQSIRYKQFIESVSNQFDHILGDIQKKKIEDHIENMNRMKKKNSWLSYKSAIIAAGGAIIVQIIQSTMHLITSLLTAVKGTP